ncbi:hypothetical protein ACFLYK_00090 [Candidatus Cloacimonadota bacterium]
MRKLLVLLIVLAAALSLNAVYEVGDVVTEDLSWTDSNNEYHSIFELTESGRAVMIFFGQSW